jgi:hypothetical protein
LASVPPLLNLLLYLMSDSLSTVDAATSMRLHAAAGTRPSDAPRPRATPSTGQLGRILAHAKAGRANRITVVHRAERRRIGHGAMGVLFSDMSVLAQPKERGERVQTSKSAPNMHGRTCPPPFASSSSFIFTWCILYFCADLPIFESTDMKNTNIGCIALHYLNWMLTWR